MYSIRTYNQIAPQGIARFPQAQFQVSSDVSEPDALLLRSHKLTPADMTPQLKAIARAGAGVNNIPVSSCTELGIVVFNTPGANANAVKELVGCALLMSSRGVVEGIQYARSLTHLPAAELHAQLEKDKKRFAGGEVAGKTLGVVGLGAIGSLVANMALQLGMRVVGYDPALSVEAAWRLPANVERMENLPMLLSRSDYVTLHLPALDATRGLINADLLRHARPGLRLLNFARPEIVALDAVVAALDEGRLARYATDFPEPELLARDDVLLMPHIGASTAEAEENCAVMAADQLVDFLAHGNIRNSVNFPSLMLERGTGYRLAITNRNVPKILSHVLDILADRNINVIDMLNKSRDDIAYNLIDIADAPDAALLDSIRSAEGIVNVRAVY